MESIQTRSIPLNQSVMLDRRRDMEGIGVGASWNRARETGRGGHRVVPPLSPCSTLRVAKTPALNSASSSPVHHKSLPSQDIAWPWITIDQPVSLSSGTLSWTQASRRNSKSAEQTESVAVVLLPDSLAMHSQFLVPSTCCRAWIRSQFHISIMRRALTGSGILAS